MGDLMAKRKKTFTPNDLQKAIEEAYELGYQHGQNGKKTLGVLSPEIETKINIAALRKNLDENGKKINIELINQHRSLTLKHMKAWSDDAEKAMADIIANSEHDHKE
jgi:glycine cleavage system aminomethyltransferase T